LAISERMTNIRASYKIRASSTTS